MREIKFRAWHEGHRAAPAKMLYDEKQGDCLVWKSQGQNIKEIMQFTGLKDKSGKEIYEGDVILFSDERWEIVYAECGFFITQKGKISQWLALVLNKSEVIGNIYENKELLERGEV
jgi:hypothetical protein